MMYCIMKIIMELQRKSTLTLALVKSDERCRGPDAALMTVA